MPMATNARIRRSRNSTKCERKESSGSSSPAKSGRLAGRDSRFICRSRRQAAGVTGSCGAFRSFLRQVRRSSSTDRLVCCTARLCPISVVRLLPTLRADPGSRFAISAVLPTAFRGWMSAYVAHVTLQTTQQVAGGARDFGSRSGPMTTRATMAMTIISEKPTSNMSGIHSRGNGRWKPNHVTEPPAPGASSRLTLAAGLLAL